MAILAAIGIGLYTAFSMFWQTSWALVLGFGLSGAVQAFVSRPQMQRALGDHRPGAMGKASFFGCIGSSCSYAAAALAKSLFSRRCQVWADAAGYTISDVTMLRKELLIGFLVAGFLAALVPSWLWQSIFLTGHGFWSSLENVLIAPFLLAVEYIFRLIRIPDPPRPVNIVHGGIAWDYTTYLNIAALLAFGLLYWLYRTRDARGGKYAKDPVCGMQGSMDTR